MYEAYTNDIFGVGRTHSCSRARFVRRFLVSLWIAVPENPVVGPGVSVSCRINVNSHSFDGNGLEQARFIVYYPIEHSHKSAFTVCRAIFFPYVERSAHGPIYSTSSFCLLLILLDDFGYYFAGREAKAYENSFSTY